MDRAKQRVVLDPPRLLAEKRLHQPRTTAVATPVGVEEQRERGCQRGPFQAADLRVLDPRGAPDMCEHGAVVPAERQLTAERGEFRHRRHADEEWVDRHRADRGVGRLLTRRHFIDRKQLQHALACGGEPRGERREVADLADPPAGG
jgi:hypothetical protein